MAMSENELEEVRRDGAETQCGIETVGIELGATLVAAVATGQKPNAGLKHTRDGAATLVVAMSRRGRNPMRD